MEILRPPQTTEEVPRREATSSSNPYGEPLQKGRLLLIQDYPSVWFPMVGVMSILLLFALVFQKLANFRIGFFMVSPSTEFISCAFGCMGFFFLWAVLTSCFPNYGIRFQEYWAVGGWKHTLLLLIAFSLFQALAIMMETQAWYADVPLVAVVSALGPTITMLWGKLLLVDGRVEYNKPLFWTFFVVSFAGGLAGGADMLAASHHEDEKSLSAAHVFLTVMVVIVRSFSWILLSILQRSFSSRMVRGEGPAVNALPRTSSPLYLSQRPGICCLTAAVICFAKTLLLLVLLLTNMRSWFVVDGMFNGRYIGATQSAGAVYESAFDDFFKSHSPASYAVAGVCICVGTFAYVTIAFFSPLLIALVLVLSIPFHDIFFENWAYWNLGFGGHFGTGSSVGVVFGILILIAVIVYVCWWEQSTSTTTEAVLFSSSSPPTASTFPPPTARVEMYPQPTVSSSAPYPAYSYPPQAGAGEGLPPTYDMALQQRRHEGREA